MFVDSIQNGNCRPNPGVKLQGRERSSMYLWHRDQVVGPVLQQCADQRCLDTVLNLSSQKSNPG